MLESWLPNKYKNNERQQEDKTKMLFNLFYTAISRVD